jgi:hypothetical protein
MKPPTSDAKAIRRTMMGYRSFSAPLLLGILLGLQAGALFAAVNEAALPTSRFELAIIGDVPYNAQEEAKFPDLMAAIDRTDVVFVVYNGDFKWYKPMHRCALRSAV